MTLDADGTSRKADPFLKLPHRLLDAILHSRMKLSEKLLVIVVYDKTRGYFNMSTRELAQPFLAKASGLAEKTVAHATDRLVREGVLVEEKPATNRRGRVLGVQNDPAKWGAFAPGANEEVEGPESPPEDVEGPESPPEDEGEVRETPLSPVRDSPLERKPSPPSNKQQTPLVRRTAEVADSISCSRPRDFPESECEAHVMMTAGDSPLVVAVGPVDADALFRGLCDCYRRFGDTDDCTRRLPICADAARDLVSKCTPPNARSPQAYVRKLLAGLGDDSTDLIGSRAERLCALRRVRPEEDERRDDVVTQADLEAIFG